MEPVTPALDDLGPAVCPTCGSVQLDAMDPLRAVSGVLLSLLASLLALVSLCSFVAGLILIREQGPGILLLGVGAGVMAVLAGVSSHRIARRPARHQSLCQVCGEREGRWTSTSSDAAGLFATLVSGPLLLPGLSLLAIAFGTIGTVAQRLTFALFGGGLALVALTIALVRRPWLAARGTDWASGSTLGRLFVWGQGVGTNPELRPHLPSDRAALALLTPPAARIADELADLVSRGVISLESRDDIVWSRFLSHHRMTIVPSDLHAACDLGGTLGNDESDLAEALVRELRAQARQEAGGDGQDYRADQEVPGDTLPQLRVRLPLLELLGRAGVPLPEARAVEGALRASIKPRRLGSHAYKLLRRAGEQRSPVLRKPG